MTVLVADVEDSTRLRDTALAGRAGRVPTQREVVAETVAAHGGVPLGENRERDALVAAFRDPSDAVSAALDARRVLLARDSPEGPAGSGRFALHTYAAEAQHGLGGMLAGPALSRCARLCTIARSGQTLLSRSTRDLVADRLPGAAGLVDLGVRRLPDLGPPEHVYALVHPDLPRELAPLRSLDELPNNLPREPSSFVGRERELAAIRAALDATRLLTLTGAGGCGKTRLALHAAADALHLFPDGAWWVDLAPVTDPGYVGQALVDALGVRPLPHQRALDAAVARLTRRRALVVLDNSEHLIDGVASAAEALLEGCPEVTVLLTSRTPVGLPAEVTWRVPSLSLLDAGAAPTVDALLESDAGRLFVERAIEARNDLPLTGARARAVAAVCSEVDGIPLAIELAAHRVRLLSVEQIAAGLSDRFRLLGGGASATLPRHRTLRASLDWSYDLLAEEERLLFRLLGVFVGGFTLEAVEQVRGDDGRDDVAVLDGLGALVDGSLVVAEERGPAVRYHLLETVREYALGRLSEAGELEAARDRHLDHFLVLAERAAPELLAARQREWLDALDPDGPNLTSALEWASRRDGERALRLCGALTIWWRLRGMFAAADAGCVQALDAPAPPRSVLRGRVLWGRSYLLTFAARYEDAIETAQQAVDLAEAIGDASTAARALNVLGMIRQSWDPVGSRPLMERSRELARASGDDWAFAAVTNTLGWSYLVTDEYDEAEQLFEESFPIIERLGYLEFSAWHWIGMSYRQLVAADGERLFDLAERAEVAARKVGEPVTEGVACAFTARLELAQGRTEDAVGRLEASRERVVATGAGMALALTDTILAQARAAAGDLDGARAGLEQVVQSGADFGRVLSWAMLQLADVLRVAGNQAGAEEQARQALEVSERIQSPVSISWCMEIFGRLAAGRGQWSEAEALLHDALAARAERGARLWIPQTLDALAEVESGLAAHEQAARLLGAAERARSDLGLVRWAPDDPACEALERNLRATLGDGGFAGARDEGSGLTLEEAVAWVRRGRGSRKRPPGGWESLTPTELEVSRHVAAGLTNPEIGTRMFITRGTVKSHLSHIYAKLGVRNRAELTAEAARHLPVGHP
ncbi:MAG TPA: LuxR C-terminal-related transcriptional regulator [Thermoleophilaceae bacterium]